MDFKEFNRLYRKDTISFLIALNLYLDYGSTVLRAGSREDLSGAAALEISSLFAAEKRDHIVETARKLAEMEPNDLIPYLSQCGIRTGASSSDEPGVCPVCGGRIKYDHEGSSEWNFILTWHCLDCGATGEENHHWCLTPTITCTRRTGIPFSETIRNRRKLNMKIVYIPRGETMSYDNLTTECLVVEGCLKVTYDLRAKKLLEAALLRPAVFRRTTFARMS